MKGRAVGRGSAKSAGGRTPLPGATGGGAAAPSADRASVDAPTSPAAPKADRPPATPARTVGTRRPNARAGSEPQPGPTTPVTRRSGWVSVSTAPASPAEAFSTKRAGW